MLARACESNGLLDFIVTTMGLSPKLGCSTMVVVVVFVVVVVIVVVVVVAVAMLLTCINYNIFI
jgi:hypothetical protein